MGENIFYTCTEREHVSGIYKEFLQLGMETPQKKLAKCLIAKSLEYYMTASQKVMHTPL